MDGRRDSVSKPVEQLVRCRKCRKLLCKVTSRDAVRQGEQVEIKCSNCNDVNYLVGRP